MQKFVFGLLILLSIQRLSVADTPTAPREIRTVWGDQGDGTYKNFILWSDACNPDVVRVGKDFYMVTSTVHLSPNMAIYHSLDAVNWTIVGHVVADVTQFSPKYGYDQMQGAGYGSWAASLRYHDGKFWVYVIDPTEGLFMSTATNPAGPWEPLHLVSGDFKNHDDPSVLWDDDGKVYLSCADFSKSSPGTHIYEIKLFQLSADGRQMLDSGTVIHRGRIAEATKLYKISGYYYLMHTEEPGRKQWLMRSKIIYGPYESKIVFQSPPDDKYKPVNEGCLVQLAGGKWIYLAQCNYTTVWGWPLALLPVRWTNGWPFIGKDVNQDGIGEMVWEGKKPIAGEPICRPQSSDEFDSPQLQPQWEFNFEPMTGAYSLAAHPGFLRLYAKTPLGDKVETCCCSV